MVAVVAVLHFDSATPGGISLVGVERQRDVPESIAVLDQGGPPLLAPDKRPLPDVDDPGIYLYLPLLGHAFGIENPNILLKWFLLGLFSLALLLYPLVFYEVFRSAAAALAAPILLLLHEYRFYERTTEVYWIAAWCLYLCVPILLLLYRRPWDRLSLVVLAALNIVASFATSLRYPAGLPILLASLLLILFRERRWARRLSVAAVAFVAYISISTIAFGAITAARDRSAGLPAGRYKISPTWHLTYIGLGYVDNRFGIRAQDQIAYEHAKRSNPGLVYFGPGYERAVRHQYFRVLERDPGFVARSYALKLGAVLRDGPIKYWVSALLLAAMLSTAWAGGVRRSLLLLVPAFVFAILPPILTQPIPKYEEAWRAMWILLEIVGVAWLLARGPSALLALGRRLDPPAPAELGSWLRARARRVDAAATLRRPLVWGIAAAALVFLLLTEGPYSREVSEARAEAPYLQSASPLTNASSVRGTDQSDWTFRGGLPADWRKLDDHIGLRNRRSGLLVRTSAFDDGAQLASSDIRLSPATYDLVFSGNVLRGGMLVEVADAVTGEVLTTAQSYPGRYAASSATGKSLVATFTLYRPTAVRVVLVNHVPTAVSSRWSIRDVRISSPAVRLLARPVTTGSRGLAGRNPYHARSVEFYGVRATPLAADSESSRPHQEWSFADGIPASWFGATGLRVERRSDGVSVATTADAAGSDSQLQSPSFRLSAGTYRAVARGAVTDGGLQLGVVGVGRRAFLSNSFFWSGQDFSTGVMTTSFQLPRAAIVRVALANWVSLPHSSTWRLSDVRIERADLPAEYRRAILADSPVGFWQLAERTGRLARDVTGNADGRYEGNLALGADGPLPGIDPAASLDGQNDGVTIPTTAALQTRAFSVEAWLNFSSLERAAIPLGSTTYTPTAGSTGWYWFEPGNGAPLTFNLGTKAGATESVGSIVVVPNEWHQYVATYDGSTVRVYLDGVLNAEARGVTFAPNRRAPLTIGYGLQDGRPLYFLRGSVADVAVYGSALSQQRVVAHFRAGSGL